MVKTFLNSQLNVVFKKPQQLKTAAITSTLTQYQFRNYAFSFKKRTGRIEISVKLHRQS